MHVPAEAGIKVSTLKKRFLAAKGTLIRQCDPTAKSLASHRKGACFSNAVRSVSRGSNATSLESLNTRYRALSTCGGPWPQGSMLCSAQIVFPYETCSIATGTAKPGKRRVVGGSKPAEFPDKEQFVDCT
eukprot:17083-Heterococcus_DN1.PRE.1